MVTRKEKKHFELWIEFMSADHERVMQDRFTIKYQ